MLNYNLKTRKTQKRTTPKFQKLPPLSRTPRKLTKARRSFVSKTMSFENFLFSRVIGTGAFSEVTLAKHKQTKKHYAVKIMRKEHIIKHNQVDHVKDERKALMKINSPFVVKLIGTFQDTSRLYIVEEFVSGGELYKQLRLARSFQEETVKFYLAELVCAFSSVHSSGVLYRDLKPENVLLDSNGHIKLVDFGFCKHLEDQEYTYSLCGTPEYLAPEIINYSGQSFKVDIWTLGVLMHELLTGKVPFSDRNPYKLYLRILNSELSLPNWIVSPARSLLESLLQKSPFNRPSIEEVKQHEFFKGINWDEVPQLKLTPPIKPLVDLAEKTPCLNLESLQPLKTDYFPEF